MSETILRKEKAARIFIVNDYPIVRFGLTQLLNKEDDLTVCGEVDSATETIEVIEKSKPDLAIVALFLRGIDDMELIKSLKQRFSKLHILVFSVHDETIFAQRVIRAGAKGYIMKRAPATEILKAVRRVLNGEIYVSDGMVSKILNQLANGGTSNSSSSLEHLSDRELQIFKLIGKGHDLRKIAKALYLSVKTVETHCAHIKEKLSLKSANELMHFAIKWIDSGGEF